MANTTRLTFGYRNYGWWRRFTKRYEEVLVLKKETGLQRIGQIGKLNAA
jgi:hypothetical protein